MVREEKAVVVVRFVVLFAADTKTGGHPATGGPVGSPDERCAP